MSYQVTARKWRPMVFDDVVGQTHVTGTLRNAIASKRVAHAYLFSGTRGCGKTTTARILARALNCLSPIDHNPDNTCDVCREIIDGRSLDVIEIDGASNRGVEEIRNLRDSVRYMPTHGAFKVYIIDEVHMLTKEAFNALLKTLEEPPAHVIFIFATTEVHKLPMTILSRCQRFDFRRIAIEEIVKRLSFIAGEESVTVEPEALSIIARRADGSLRDAQSIFDQVRSFCGNEITAAQLLAAFNVVDVELYFRFTTLVREHDSRGAIAIVDELLRNGHDLREFAGGLVEHLRNLLIVRSTGESALVESSDAVRKRYADVAPAFQESDLLRLLKQAIDLDQSLRWASQPRYRLEAALLQMVRMETSVQIQDLLRGLDDLKKKLNDGHRPPVSDHPLPTHHRDASSSVRVAGEAVAGYLKSSAAVRYSPETPRASVSALRSDVGDSSASSSSTPILPLVAKTESSSALCADDIRNRWKEYVGDVQSKRIALGMTLSESHVLDATNGVLRLQCPDDFHFATIKRHREYLAETFQQFFGSRIHVEPCMQGSMPAPQMASAPAMNPETAPPPVGANGEEHPLIAILKRDFGAEPIRRP